MESHSFTINMKNYEPGIYFNLVELENGYRYT